MVFVGSAQEASVARYLPHLTPALIREAFADKIRRTKRPKDRERLQRRLSVLDAHLEKFWACVERNELVPDESFEAVHFAACMCWQFKSRDIVLARGIRTGSAFGGIGRGAGESGIVWDKTEAELMRSVKPPMKINRTRK